jgi:GNAT superfamily N-acetyltransferase
MLLETLLEDFPKVIPLKHGLECQLRPLQADDESAFHEFFLAVPERERLFIKHRVTEREVIRDWCQNIDLGRNLPLLAVTSGKIVGCSTLHQHLGGWRRHIGRVSVLVHPEYRGRGVARALVTEIIEIAHQTGLERIEAEFVAEQEAAMKVFGLLGFTSLVRLPGYVKDMQATPHDYVLTALDLPTDEEYAGAG